MKRICRSPSAARRCVWRWLVCISALVALLGDVWQAGHLLAVRHVACPYDGALVHEDELSNEARDGALSSADVAENQSSIVEQHEHHGCDALGALQRQPAVAPVERVDVSRVADERCESSASPSVDARRDVLTYAPRLPPPLPRRAILVS